MIFDENAEKKICHACKSDVDEIGDEPQEKEKKHDTKSKKE